MTNKQLRTLDKRQLLSILRQQELDIQLLIAEKKSTSVLRKKLALEREELKKMREEIAKEREEMTQKFKGRADEIEQANSIPEASIMLNEVVKTMQEAADLYIKNIKMIEEVKTVSAEKIESEARERAEAMLQETERKCKAMESEGLVAVNKWQEHSQQLCTMIANFHEKLHKMIEELDVLRQLPPIDTSLYAQ